MTTKAQKVTIEEQEAREKEGVIVADEAIMELSKEILDCEKRIAKINEEKEVARGLIKDHMKKHNAIEIVQEDGTRLWYTSESYTPKFDVKAMVAAYPILAPLVKRFTKTTVAKKLYFTRP